MRASAVFTMLSAIGFAVSAWGYLVISTPAHFAKAANILANPNGDIVWVETWQSNRQICLVCGCISLVVFICSYCVLWRAQREENT
ncbi:MULTISPECIES: hypothetical protein [unclassified Bradyrhizobium]|uniref:hypothetical protein n=1 Tax=unclassified Bradyrhizobium TaxID=2631580 RepID=UPI0029170DF0|nr:MULTISPECIES: hypothetical protein [unclassified Bradyrhizobium]